MNRTMFLGVGLVLALSPVAGAADLTVALDGLRSDNGILMIAVFDSAAKFRNEGQEVAALRLRARQGPSRVTLAGLPAGAYAIAAYHDENGNGRLDANLLGVPTEGYGFSNDARGSFGPPGFDDARFTLGVDGATVTIKIAY